MLLRVVQAQSGRWDCLDQLEECAGSRTRHQIAYLALMTAADPPLGRRFWLEWHRVRSVNPDAYKATRSLPPKLRRAVIERDGFVCGICHKRVRRNDVDIDHIVPRVHGGSDKLSNLRVTHSRCNRRKGVRSG
jgi:hypothetical protein